MPIASVLVSLDGSRFAEAALPVAARLARLAGARVRLVSAHEPVLTSVPAAEVPVTVSRGDDQALKAQQQAYLTSTARELGLVGGREVEVAVIDGLAGPVLVEESNRCRPDFFVMATHGRGPLSRLWLGSVADHLLRHASVPLLLLRPREQQDATPAETPFRRGIVALDRSPEAEAILGPVVELARLHQSHLTLTTVIELVVGATAGLPPFPVGPSQDAIEALQAGARQYLDGVVARLASDGIRATGKVMFGPGLGVAPALLAELDAPEVDFIAMTTHGASGFRRLLLGSVADKVVRGAHKPVLVVRPGAG